MSAKKENVHDKGVFKHIISPRFNQQYCVNQPLKYHLNAVYFFTFCFLHQFVTEKDVQTCQISERDDFDMFAGQNTQHMTDGGERERERLVVYVGCIVCLGYLVSRLRK